VAACFLNDSAVWLIYSERRIATSSFQQPS